MRTRRHKHLQIHAAPAWLHTCKHTCALIHACGKRAGVPWSPAGVMAVICLLWGRRGRIYGFVAVFHYQGLKKQSKRETHLSEFSVCIYTDTCSSFPFPLHSETHSVADAKPSPFKNEPVSVSKWNRARLETNRLCFHGTRFEMKPCLFHASEWNSFRFAVKPIPLQMRNRLRFKTKPFPFQNGTVSVSEMKPHSFQNETMPVSKWHRLRF